MTQVLIVGAGPVGLAMAAELARYGVAVRIVDQAPAPSVTSKALVIWSRTLELMERMGCVEPFLAAGLRAHGVTIRNDGAVLGHVDFGLIESHYNFGLMLPQSETERLLGDHLASLGVTVERRTRLVDFAQTEGGVQARLARDDGATETITMPWLIGCDGAHSVVRHGLGMTFTGSPQGDDWALADLYLQGDAAPPADEIATYFHRDGPLVIFPIGQGRVRIVADIGKADPDTHAPDPSLADIQALIDERCGGGFRAHDPVWLTTFRINERKVAEYRSGRVFLAGDAAHIHSPAGGQGMNTGIQDAVNLAWKLAMVERDAAAPSLLDSYSPERSAVGDAVLRNAGALTRVATLASPLAQTARDWVARHLLGFSFVQGKMVTGMGETAIAYPDSPLSRGPGAGRRLAPELYDGPPPGAGGDPRFTLFGKDEGLAGRFPKLVDPVVRKGSPEAETLLVRPDGYVGFAGDEAAAETYLAAIAP